MQHISRRGFLQGTIGASLLGGLAACGSGNTVASGVTLQYWDYFVSQAPWVDNERKLFQQAHKGITVNKVTQSTDKYPDFVSLAMRSHKSPDVLVLPRTPTLSEQASSKWLLPLDKWATTQWKSRFPKGYFYEGNNEFDGKTYSAPFGGLSAPYQLYCNNAVFKAAGLTNDDGSTRLPVTWDDVTHFAERITKKSGGKAHGLGFGNTPAGPIVWWVDMFVRGAGSPGGAQLQDLRTGKWPYGSDRNFADFFQLLLEWKSKGYIYPSSQSMSDEQARAFFERGKFGMTIGGVWNQPEWTEHKFTDYTLTTLPSPTGTPKALYYADPGGTLFGISASTKHRDEAWAWLDWLYSPAAGARWVQLGQGLSVYPQNNDPSKVADKQFAQYVALKDKQIIGPTPAIRNPGVAKVQLQAVKPDIIDVSTGIFTGQIKDIGSALSQLEHRQQQALTEAIGVANKQGAKVSLSDYAFPDWDPSKPYLTAHG